MKDKNLRKPGVCESAVIKRFHREFIQDNELDIDSRIVRRLRTEGILSDLIHSLEATPSPSIDGLVDQAIELIKTAIRNKKLT